MVDTGALNAQSSHGPPPQRYVGYNENQLNQCLNKETRATLETNKVPCE